MNLNHACWAKSKVRANTSHLFYSDHRTSENVDTRDGSACGSSSLTACEAPVRLEKPPPDACASCKGVWDSWVAAGQHPVSTPHPPKQSEVTRKQRRRASHDASCAAYLAGATPEQAIAAGRKAYAGAQPHLPSEAEVKLAANLLAGLSVKTHPPLISNDADDAEIK